MVNKLLLAHMGANKLLFTHMGANKMLLTHMGANKMLLAHMGANKHYLTFQVMTNKFTGEPAGYGFINFDSDQTAIIAMHRFLQ